MTSGWSMSVRGGQVVAVGAQARRDEQAFLHREHLGPLAPGRQPRRGHAAHRAALADPAVQQCQGLRLAGAQVGLDDGADPLGQLVQRRAGEVAGHRAGQPPEVPREPREHGQQLGRADHDHRHGAGGEVRAERLVHVAQERGRPRRRAAAAGRGAGPGACGRRAPARAGSGVRAPRAGCRRPPRTAGPAARRAPGRCGAGCGASRARGRGWRTSGPRRRGRPPSTGSVSRNEVEAFTKSATAVPVASPAAASTTRSSSWSRCWCGSDPASSAAIRSATCRASPRSRVRSVWCIDAAGRVFIRIDTRRVGARALQAQDERGVGRADLRCRRGVRGVRSRWSSIPPVLW